MKHTEPKPEKVQNLFGSIAKTYDTANDAMTFGMARLWRRKLVKVSGAKQGDSILDCATGTGDLAIDFKKVVKEGAVIGSDFSPEMLSFAGPKAKKQNLDILFEIADATQLKYSSQQFDITSIAYGIRNVGSLEKAFSELARVTKPGGKVMILETGTQKNPIVRTLISLYFTKIVPIIGGLISKEKWAYDYLNDTSRNFPGGEDFAQLLRETQLFSEVKCKTLMLGASYIYTGVVK